MMKGLALKQNRIASDSNAAKEAARRTFLPNSSSEPNFDKQSQSSAQAQLQSSARQAPQLRSKDSRFSFGEPENANSPTPPSFDFLPPINFDDFQTTISTYDSPKSKHQQPRSQLNPPPSIKASINSKPQPMTITQRESSVPNLSHLSAAPPSQLQTSASTSVLPVRARRGSQTGPGAPAITASGITARVTRKPMAPQPDKKQQSNLSRTPSLNANARKTQGSTPQPPNPDTSFAAPTRSSKAKSLQPLPRSATLTDLPQPEQRRSVNVKVTNRSKTPRTDTPSDKRKSGRMSGLGARTISPTDARRLRRMSTKQGPPSPSKELTHPRSPSATPRRPAMTPSSNRATPETSNRMAPPPNLNLSRTSSYQSLRAPSAGQGKIGQSASTSKLPTPKSRNLYSAAERRDDEEMVPPVPAIPKAYESPKDLVDIPFFSGLKTPLAAGMDNEGSALPIPTRRGESSTTPDSRQHQHRRGLTVGNGANSETPPAMPAVNKKTLQPLRLPPLNLLPLSTPTAARINSYPAPSQEVDARGTTPPFKRNAAKTPSTPMTASKATFYRRHDDEPSVPFNARSNSTQPGARVPRYEEPNNGVLLPPSSPGKRQAITPFTSGSLPKPSSKYSKPPRLPDEFTLGNHDVEPHASKPMGPRPRTVSKSVKETASINTVSSTEDQEQPPPSAATGLRRKLSLGWRKTPPKATTTSNAEPLKLQTKYDDMPPPKIPASATWSTDSPISGSSSGRPSFESTKLESHRSKPSVSSNNKMPHLESAPAAKPPMPSNIAVRQPQVSTSSVPQASAPPQGQRSTSWSILGSMNRTLGSKNTPPQPKPRTINALHLDKDDVAANDEMRRLSTKRRDIDVAARETEELRKRATQKERMTPAQAIQSSAGVLNIYEKGEIIDYKDGVWFCGSKQAKKHVGDISAAGTTNFGYDDERGDYNIVMGDHLGYRYEVIDVLGKGSFGQVVRCIDHKLGTLCAVKIIRNKKRFHQQALVEVNILQKLKEWVSYQAITHMAISLMRIRILMRQMQHLPSHHPFTSETIFASHLPLSASTSTNLSEHTTSLASRYNSFAVSHARYSPVYAYFNLSELSTAISSRKTYFFATHVVLMYESSTLEVPAKQTRKCIRTFNPVSTVHQRSFLVVTMALASICGVLDAFLLNCLPGIPSSLVRTNKNNSRVSWKSSAHLLGILSKRHRGGSCFSTRLSSHESQFRVKAEEDDLVARLSAVPSSAMMRHSSTSSPSVFAGILRSVCDQTRRCRILSSLTSRSDERVRSVRVLETRLQPLRLRQQQHRNLQSSVFTRQTRLSQQCRRKRQRRLPAHVPYQIPQLQPRVMELRRRLTPTIR